jgi:hypothetical protein
MPLQDTIPAYVFKGLNLNQTNTDLGNVLGAILLPAAAPGFVVATVALANFRTRQDANDPLNATANGATATFGLFTAAAGGGTAIVANAALTGATGNTVYLTRTVATPAQIFSVDRLFPRVGTAAGTACFADLYIELRNVT